MIVQSEEEKNASEKWKDQTISKHCIFTTMIGDGKLVIDVSHFHPNEFAVKTTNKTSSIVHGTRSMVVVVFCHQQTHIYLFQKIPVDFFYVQENTKHSDQNGFVTREFGLSTIVLKSFQLINRRRIEITLHVEYAIHADVRFDLFTVYV